MSPTNASFSDTPASCNVPQALAVIRDTFALSSVQLAKVFGVSKEMIYQWIEGGSVPTKHRQRVAAVRSLAQDWNESGVGRLQSLPGDSDDRRGLLDLPDTLRPGCD